MIKPFVIQSIREEPDGAKTVFFEVTKTILLDSTTSSTETMQTAIVVPPNEDVDQYLFADLQKSGWV